MKPRLEIRFTPQKQRIFCSGKRYEPVQGEFLLNHARCGIMLALKALNLPAGSSVGVMAYNCHTVFNAIAQAGFSPSFIDVTHRLVLDLEDLRRKRSSIKALIVTHLFGFVNDIASIRQEFPDLPIIEDGAHATGLDKYSGDFTVFSIGQGKLPSLGDGGILHVNNKAFLEKTKQLIKSLPDYSFAGEFRLFGALLFKSLLYQPWIYPWLTQPLKRNRKPSSGIETIFPRKMSAGVRALYQAELKTLPETIRQRRQNATKMGVFLEKIPGVKEVFTGSINGFMVVVWCEDLASVRDDLRKQGIEAETHFSNCLHWAQSFGYTEGLCPNTEIILGHLLMVPTYSIR